MGEPERQESATDGGDGKFVLRDRHGREYLAALMHVPDGAKLNGSLLPADPFHFPDARQRAIVLAANNLVARGVGPQLPFVLAELERLGTLEVVVERHYVENVASDVAFVYGIRDLAATIRRQAAADHLEETFRRGLEVLHRPSRPDDDADLLELNENGRALIEQMSGTGEPLPSEDLAAILERPAPVTPWAANGLIARGDIGLISGPGGIGKTWVALDVCLQLATGGALFGLFDLERSFRIAIVDLESRP